MYAGEHRYVGGVVYRRTEHLKEDAGLVGRRRDSASVPSYKFIGPARFSILLNSRTYQDLVVLRTYHVREKNRIEGCRNQNHHHQPAAVW
jgi:hypothetical protein